MPQGNVPQYSGHNYTTTETGIKYRTLNGGNPLSHDDVDANYDILRKAINGLVADIGLANSTSSSGIASIQSSLTSLQSTIAGQISALQTEVSGIETNVTNITNGTTNITWDQITGAPDQLNNADTNGATFGDTVNSIPAIELTYPAGPRIRGGAQGVSIVTDNQDSNGNYIDSVPSNAGLSCSMITLRGGNGPSSSPAGVGSTTSFFHDSDGLQIYPLANNSSNDERVLIRGDLKVEGKIIADSDLVVDGDLEDSSGNAVGGGGPWSSWLDIDVPSARKHFGPSGTGVYDVNFHTHVPGAIEVFIEAHVGEAYLQYWNTYTATWTTIISAPDNYGMNGGVCIRLAPGYYDPSTGTAGEITHPPSTLQVIAPGTVKFNAGMAAGDEVTADVIWLKIRRWR